MWELFGLGAQQQAEREVGELNDNRSGLRNWDLGDRFRSALTGVSQEDVTRRAGEIVAKKVNQSNASARRTIGSQSGALDVGDLNIGKNETEADYNARITEQTGRVNALQQLRGLDNGDTLTVDPNASVTQMQGLASGLRRKNKKDANTETHTEVLRQEGRADALRGEAYLEAAKVRADDRSEARAQRGFDRERGEARDMLSLQIAQMDSQLADKRMAYDRETRRMDRRDQMIAQLMSGLGQLGGAFSL
jgi:hypothetical protein